MVFESFIESYKEFIGYSLVILDNYCMYNNVENAAASNKLEKAYNLLGKCVSPGYHMNIINKLYDKEKAKIINYVRKGEPINFKTLANANLELKSDGDLKIAINNIHGMAVNLDDNKINNKEEPIYVNKFMFYFLRLISNCTMADDVKNEIIVKTNELGTKTGIIITQGGTGPAIFDFLKLVAKGDIKNKISSYITKENIDIARDFSKNILGEEEFIDDILDKVENNSANPFTAITEIFNDDGIIEKVVDKVKGISENESFNNVKLQIKDITDSISSKINIEEAPLDDL